MGAARSPSRAELARYPHLARRRVSSPELSVATGVFDADFFSSTGFHERLQQFSRDRGDPGYHGDATLRVEIVTLTGDRLDTVRLEAAEGGARLSTRDDRLAFIPYEQIAYIDVSVLQDHRIPGFQLSTSSE